MTLGRDPRCDARLDSLQVSRFHCCVSQIDDGVHVSDLGSTNGTRINGRCVKSGRLRPGDELMIADLRYRLAEHVAASTRDRGQAPVPAALQATSTSIARGNP